MGMHFYPGKLANLFVHELIMKLDQVVSTEDYTFANGLRDKMSEKDKFG